MTSDNSDTTYGYFQGHECHLPPEKLCNYEIYCNSFKKFFLNYTAVKISDVRARSMYRSFAAVSKEKRRHCMLFPCSIHPFSKFRLWFELFFIFYMLLFNIALVIHYSEKGPHETVYFAFLLNILDWIYLINIFGNFVTGYVEGEIFQHVVLDLKKIIIKYLGSWFIIDVISSATLVSKFLTVESITLHLLFVSLKLLRLPVYYKYIMNVLTATRIKDVTKLSMEILFLLFSYLTWNMYFQFSVEYMFEDSFTPENPRNCSWLTIGKLWNATVSLRYVYALDRAVSMLRDSANLNFIEKGGCFETFYIIFWIMANILVFHCAIKYIIVLFGSESARAKYFMMQQEVESYMRQRRLPPRIKKKILKFYAIRFQSHFYVESRMMSCVSGQLREDIIMHTGRQLVRDVEFLKQLPRALLLQIGMKLTITVFLGGDIIFKINTAGDCLYFIDKGTIAIYSESGKEICHLEDGDFFGEIALVMKHRARTTTAVAVTNCELFRLDREDFESSIACYPTTYEEIKKVAWERYEKMKVMDEYHKTEMKMIEKTI